MLKQLTAFLRWCLPSRVRQMPALQRVKNRLNRRFLGHDGVYDADYYSKTVEEPAQRSADVISASIVEKFHPESVIDVGCGTGALLASLRRRSIRVKGLEYSEAGLQFCAQRKLDVTKFDLEADNCSIKESFDVAVSMEVAEHLPESVAERYVDLLTGLSNVVIFTAATPGQGGQDHVNEQPHSYWISKFKRNGFALDEKLTETWKKEWRTSGSVVQWYFENLLVFRKGRAEVI